MIRPTIFFVYSWKIWLFHVVVFDVSFSLGSRQKFEHWIFQKQTNSNPFIILKDKLKSSDKRQILFISLLFFWFFIHLTLRKFHRFIFVMQFRCRVGVDRAASVQLPGMEIMDRILAQTTTRCLLKFISFIFSILAYGDFLLGSIGSCHWLWDISHEVYYRFGQKMDPFSPVSYDT